MSKIVFDICAYTILSVKFFITIYLVYILFSGTDWIICHFSPKFPQAFVEMMHSPLPQYFWK